MKRVILYHFISLITILSGVVVIGYLFIGLYELYLIWPWSILFVPLNCYIFVFCAMYLARHRIETIAEKKQRNGKIEKIKKRLTKSLKDID